LTKWLTKQDINKLVKDVELCIKHKAPVLFPSDPDLHKRAMEQMRTLFYLFGASMKVANLCALGQLEVGSMLLFTGILIYWSNQNSVPKHKYCFQVTKLVWLVPVEYWDAISHDVKSERRVKVCLESPLFHSFYLDSANSNDANGTVDECGVVRITKQLSHRSFIQLCSSVEDNTGKLERAKLRQVLGVIAFLRVINGHWKNHVAGDAPRQIYLDRHSVLQCVENRTNLCESLQQLQNHVYKCTDMADDTQINADCAMVTKCVLYFLFQDERIKDCFPVYTRGVLASEEMKWPMCALVFTSVGHHHVLNDQDVLQLVEDLFVERLHLLHVRSTFYMPILEEVDAAPYGWDSEYMLVVPDKTVSGGTLLKPVIIANVNESDTGESSSDDDEDSDETGAAVENNETGSPNTEGNAPVNATDQDDGQSNLNGIGQQQVEVTSRLRSGDATKRASFATDAVINRPTKMAKYTPSS
jgi:hypothetical protein